ncbi:conserved hypothetical protein [Talaromyces stipitatus ATCC 10500]|uniref:DUF1750-domain-containing protein n=1 Tax=Talaromyces stipitatus (strain ATCC 10500 / CBS 375.48 / QM 6759 / NRRL 1006) TaxID=441959 RepID=B8M1J7_TALSN|nr:uncharacterized protein TSTA_093300 [Talaromyces stipitatus ATCC 10500]EED22084.1 conserved hypothetical protein [Talaromyces stipitatus ATCC 10500]
MQDPAGGLPGQLVPHMHLVSRNRYPAMTALPTETVLDYLLAAPKVVRDMYPMAWTFLDGPQDGTTLLTWQPLANLGTTFASDGYVWADAEQAFTFETRGYTIEMWVQRSGYHPPQETVASHSRRRYRLVPSKVPSNAPSPDPSLWIVHYARASQNDMIPAQRIPITPQVQTTLAQRRFLQTQGQLVRKEFMLHDRNSWPTITFPAQMGAQGFAQPQAYYANAGRQPPPGAYYPPPQPGMPAGQVPVKAPRGHRTSAGSVAGAAAEFSMEDEDASTGDILDVITPREISKMRYQQHHEWIEEVFASPYTIKQITPVDLGLGRKGELESLTSGFFEAPVTSTHPKDGPNTALKEGKMEPEKAEEFADRVAKKVSDMTAEIEKLKRRHERRMQKIGRVSVLKDAEQRLREAGANPSETGREVWRLEGRIDTSTEEEVPTESPLEDISVRVPQYRVDEVVKDLEKAYGKTIVPDPSITCVEKGGLLERIEASPAPEDITGADTDMLMETSILDQFVASSTSPPGQGSQQAAVSTAVPATQPTGDGDVEMGGATNALTQSGTAAGETGDWVVVENENSGNVPSVTADKPITNNAPTGGETSGVETSNFDDAANFTNLDSAGDALAAYDDQHDGLDLPDLENSAFGDAFHASDHEMGHHPDDDEMS